MKILKAFALNINKLIQIVLLIIQDKPANPFYTSKKND